MVEAFVGSRVEDEAAEIQCVSGSPLLMFWILVHEVQVRTQCVDGGGPKDRLVVVVNWLHLVGQIRLVVWDGVNWLPCAYVVSGCLPLLF